MDFFSFAKILNESIKLLPKNLKPMAFTALLSIVLSLIIYFSFIFSIVSLTEDMSDIQKSLIPDPSSFNISDPSSFTPSLTPSQMTEALDRLKEIMVLLYAVEVAFVLVFFIISFFTTMATIIVSAISYKGNTVSIKDLFSRIARKWKRPLITGISVSIYALGYLMAVASLAAPAFIYPNIITILLAIFVGIVAMIVFLYLMVSWTLAIVVSVIEESCYGMVAMGKASTLVKGQRLNGWMLNLFFNLLVLIVVLVYQMFFGYKGIHVSFYVLFLGVIFSCLVKILQTVAYTVLYFHCKKHHGEETDVDGIIKYAVLPTTY